jgi:hypothetical protein
MSRRILKLVALVAACSVVLLSATVEQTIAVTKKATEPAPVVTTKHHKEQSEQRQNLPVQRGKKGPLPTVFERQPEVIEKPAQSVRTELKATRLKRSRRMKVHKQEGPKVVVQPRTDLMYHGMLESPQRYDPRRNHSGAGVPDPHTPELTHDHFQELDRNQDGQIDPVERTFGRLDMDRDLHNRRPR